MLPLHTRLLPGLAALSYRSGFSKRCIPISTSAPCRDRVRGSCLRLERPYLRRNLASFAQAAVPVAFGFRSTTIVIGWPAEALPQLLETISRMRRPDRDRSVIGIKLRRGAAIIDPRHLPRELAEIARRLGRDKQRYVVAMPGQRDIARGAAPMLAVIEVGLVERAPLPFVDRPGIAVPELAEFAGRLIGAGDKRDQPLGLSGFAVEGDRDAAVLVDAADRADRAVDDAGPAFVARAEVPVNWIRSFSAKGRAPSAVSST